MDHPLVQETHPYEAIQQSLYQIGNLGDGAHKSHEKETELFDGPVNFLRRGGTCK